MMPLKPSPLLALFVSEAVSLPKVGLDVESVTPAPSRVEIPLPLFW